MHMLIPLSRILGSLLRDPSELLKVPLVNCGVMPSYTGLTVPQHPPEPYLSLLRTHWKTFRKGAKYILTKSSKPQRIPENSLSPRMITEIREPTHLSISSAVFFSI